jgi:glycerol-3-phosphate acyltransferase PlsY
VGLALAITGVLVVSYLLGGIPWSLIVGKRFYGVDLRELGSGNLGATNVFRALGARAAISTLLLDALKGSVAVVIAGAIVSVGSYGATAHEWTRVAAMLAAVAGHSYSPYIRLRGGKGVATSAGALVVLTPIAFAIELVVFVTVVAASRMVSLGSLVAAALYPALVLWLYPGNTPLLVTVCVLAVLVVWRHRSNLVRIAKGEESKISLRRRGEAHGPTEDK